MWTPTNLIVDIWAHFPNLWRRKWMSFRYIPFRSTYIKPKQKWIYEFKNYYSKGFWDFIASNIHIIVTGVVLDEIWKMWKFYYGACFHSKPPMIISLCHWKCERLGMKFIHSFIHSFTSSFFSEYIKNYNVLMHDHLTRCNWWSSVKCTPCVQVQLHTYFLIHVTPFPNLL